MQFIAVCVFVFTKQAHVNLTPAQIRFTRGKTHTQRRYMWFPDVPVEKSQNRHTKSSHVK